MHLIYKKINGNFDIYKLYEKIHLQTGSYYQKSLQFKLEKAINTKVFVEVTLQKMNE